MKTTGITCLVIVLASCGSDRHDNGFFAACKTQIEIQLPLADTANIKFDNPTYKHIGNDNKIEVAYSKFIVSSTVGHYSDQVCLVFGATTRYHTQIVSVSEFEHGYKSALK